MSNSMLITGGRAPTGRVRISGAKNSATRLLAAALLTDGTVELRNFPTQLVDVRHKVEFLRRFGADVAVDDNRDKVVVNARRLDARSVDDFDCPIRTTYLLAAGPLARSGMAKIPYPGGCRIGNRGYDLHVMVWRAFGCSVEEKETHMELRASADGLRAADIEFPITTVGGTENAILCACVARGTSNVRNAYVSPEVMDLITCLRGMGAEIDVVGRSFVRVRGGGNLSGVVHSVLPDRIEALTWIVLTAVLGGDVLIEDVPFSCMEIPLIHLREAGIDVLRNGQHSYVSHAAFGPGGIHPFELACGTHPGVISDMQPFFVFLGLAASGRSKVFDYRYPERIKYVQELAKFVGPALEWRAGEISIKGPATFTAADASSTDLRGSIAAVLAALAARGQSRVRNIDMALRGYNNLMEKLNGLGLQVDIENEESAGLRATA